VIGAARLRSAFQPLDQIGTGNTQRVGDGLHREPSFGNKIGRDSRIFESALDRASRRISTSIVLQLNSPGFAGGSNF
jgi:hypothetical protein